MDLNGIPIFDTEIDKLNFVVTNESKLLYRSPLQVNSSQEISLLLMPCMYNCKACAENYFKLKIENSSIDNFNCYTKCPVGYQSNANDLTCSKNVGDQVYIKSAQISE
jgi:hypothetical protein